MIKESDLIEAIAECQGERNPNANTCIKLAAFYTLKNELYPARKETPEEIPGYSYENRETGNRIFYSGDTEFARAIDGGDMEKICAVFDELMSSLQVIEPRLYEAVLRKIRD